MSTRRPAAAATSPRGGATHRKPPHRKPASLLTATLATAALIAALAAAAALAHGFWIPLKAELAQVLLEHAWRAARAGRVDPKPWPWADTTPAARLEIPSLGVSWIVLAGASGRNLAFAPAALDGSAAPGAPGVSVISGHRDTEFRALEKVTPGMSILLEDRRGEVHTYTVLGTEIVDSRKTRLRLDADTPMLVLTTCYPFRAVTAGGPLRFLVEAAGEPGTS